MKNINNEINAGAIEENGELKYYVTIKGKKVFCTRDIYLAYKRPGRKEAMRRYRDQKPFINGKRCTYDCSQCPHYVEGLGCTNTGEVSLDQLYEDAEFEPVASQNVEEEVEIKIRIQEMYDELKDESERCRQIFTLMIEEVPDRTIAEQLGIKDGTVTYYIKKIRKRLEKFR